MKPYPSLAQVVRSVVVALLAGGVGQTNADTVSQKWAARYEGPAYDYAYGVAADAAGNVAVTGSSETSSTDTDFYTAKYAAADGHLLWGKRLGYTENGADYGVAVAMDAAGNVFVTGTTGPAGQKNYYTVKYAAADGAILWQKIYDVGTADYAYGLVLDSAGNAIVAGYSGTIKYAAADGAILWDVPNGADAGLAIDSAGNVAICTNVYGGTSHIRTVLLAAADGRVLWEKDSRAKADARGVAMDATGNVAVTGTIVEGSGFYGDFYTTLYAAGDGHVLWEVIFQGPANQLDEGYGVTFDASGNVIVTGVAAANSNSNIYTAKYAAADGHLLWSVTLDSGGVDYGKSIAVDATGNVFIAGTANRDYYAAKYAAATGQLLWDQRYNGPDNKTDYGNKLALLPGGGVAVTGSSGSAAGLFDYATVVFAPVAVVLPSLAAPVGYTIKYPSTADSTKIPNGLLWTFFVSLTGPDSALPDLALRLQYSATPNDPASWLNVAGGKFSRKKAGSSAWTLAISKMPAGTFAFRVAASASERSDSFSGASQLVEIQPGGIVEFSVLAASENDPNGRSVHAGEVISYTLRLKNAGNAPLAGAKVAINMPANVDTALYAGGSTDPNAPGFILRKGKAVSAIGFNLGSIAPGATVERLILLPVLPEAQPGAQVLLAPALGVANGKSTTAQVNIATALDKPLSNSDYRFGYSTPLTTAIESPFGFTIERQSDAISEAGEIVSYRIQVKNRAVYDLTEVTVSNLIPSELTPEVAYSRSSSGDFDSSGNAHTDFYAVVDPAFLPLFTPMDPLKPNEPRFLTWLVSNFPAGATRTFDYKARVRFDVPAFYIDAAHVNHTTDIVNDLVVATGLRGETELTGDSLESKPAHVLIAQNDGKTLPRLELTKTVIGDGTGAVFGPVPATGFFTGKKSVIHHDTYTVDAGKPIRYKLTYTNSLVSTLKRCTIYEELPDGGIFQGFVRLSLNHGPSEAVTSTNLYRLRDDKLAIVPLSDTARYPKVRYIEFLVNDIGPGVTGTLSYQVGTPSTPGQYLICESRRPKKDLAASKIYESCSHAGNTTTLAAGYQIVSDSLRQNAGNAADLVVVRTIKGVTLDPEVTVDRTHGVRPGDPLQYTIALQNQGERIAPRVVVTCPAPAGTTIIGAKLLDANGQITSTVYAEPTPASRPAAPPKSVVFNLGDMDKLPVNGGADNSSIPNLRKMRLIVRVDTVLPAALSKPGAELLYGKQVKIDWDSKRANPVAGFSLLALNAAGSSTPVLKGAENPSQDATTKLQIGPVGPRLWAMKTAPGFVHKGEKMLYTLTAGNYGNAPVEDAFVEITVPWETVSVPGLSSPDAKPVPGHPGNLRWSLGNIAPHESVTRSLVVEVKQQSTYAEGNARGALLETSCYFGSKNAGTRAPGPVATIVLSSNAFSACFQWMGAVLSGVGAALPPNSSVTQSAVNSFQDKAMSVSVSGNDFYALENGAVIVQNGNANVVAAGAGNLVSAGANVVAGGAYNVVAAGAGNVVAAGAGNLINVDRVGICDVANLASLGRNISGGSFGNIFASGANTIVEVFPLIGNDGTGVIGQDGAGFKIGRLIGNDGAAVVAGGGDFDIRALGAKIVAAGAGNIVAAGAGNIIIGGYAKVVAGGAGNFAKDVRSATFASPDALVVGTPLDEGSKLIGNDGAGLISNDSASVIGQDGGG